MEAPVVHRTDSRTGSQRRPRLGFAGVGWIGRSRMEAVVESGRATVEAIADPSADAIDSALALAPEACRAESFDALLKHDLDGIVLATPSALHAAQSRRALEQGMAVFCQKPLARTALEARAVLEAARKSDLLLGVDLCYRLVAGVPRMREMVRSGEIGQVYAADLVFHNAYGPDKPWFYDVEQGGGGCVMDLGVHLIDLALWMLGDPPIEDVSSHLFRNGSPLTRPVLEAEDYAALTLQLGRGPHSPGGTLVRATCSWNLPAGQDAVIEARFYGSEGGVVLRNIDGSFYDFLTERTHANERTVLDSRPDAWGGRTLLRWVDRLAAGAGYDAEAERLLTLHETIDRVYGREQVESFSNSHSLRR